MGKNEEIETFWMNLYYLNLPKNQHFVNFLENGSYDFLDPRKGRSYKITVVCPSVCMYVCMDFYTLKSMMYVTKMNFVNFLKIGSYDFF